MVGKIKRLHVVEHQCGNFSGGLPGLADKSSFMIKYEITLSP